MDAAKASNPVGSKVDRRMNPARVIFIDTRHNLSFRSLRPYRFVSITRRTLADPRRSLRPVSVSRYTFLLPLSTFGEQLNRILRQITRRYSFYSIFFTPIRRLLSSWTDTHVSNVAPVAPSARSSVKSAALSEFLFLPVVRPTSFRPILMENRKSDRFQQRSSLSRRKEKKKKTLFSFLFAFEMIDKSYRKIAIRARNRRNIFFSIVRSKVDQFFLFPRN